MFSHVMLGVSDIEASKKFYDAVLGTIGVGPGVENKGRYFYISPGGVFAITIPINGEPATHGNGSTVALPSRRKQHAHPMCARRLGPPIVHPRSSRPLKSGGS